MLWGHQKTNYVNQIKIIFWNSSMGFFLCSFIKPGVRVKRKTSERHWITIKQTKFFQFLSYHWNVPKKKYVIIMCFFSFFFMWPKTKLFYFCLIQMIIIMFQGIMIGYSMLLKNSQNFILLKIYNLKETIMNISKCKLFLHNYNREWCPLE